MTSHHPHQGLLIAGGLLLAGSVLAWAQTPVAGRLDFLKAHDSTFALLANTSATTQSGKQYPNQVFLITGLPSAPAVTARVDLGLGDPHCPAGEPCGRLRNIAISPDGDTALVSTDPSDVQTLAGRDVSALVLLRNVRAFAQSKNPADLRIRVFRATDFPQLDNVSGLAFGPGGQWAVVSTAGPGVLDLSYQKIRGTLVVITGLPDNPQFSRPIPVPMHSQGNIALSLDGGTLLLNDTTDRSTGVLRSNQIVMRGIQPDIANPWIVAFTHLALPDGVTDVLSPVKDAKLTLDGRFVLAPVPIIRSFDSNGQPVAYNQFEILGPIHRGDIASRVLTATDGVTGGPYYAAISPDGNSALVVNGLDLGGAELLNGLASGDAARFTLKPLPFPFFGPAFPLGPNGPPVLAPHATVVYTPDGKTALVENWVIPPLADSPLAPSISVLTGFDTGNIQIAANLMNPSLNTFDNNQQIATVPSGLLDYVNLYVPAGARRDSLTALANQAIAASDRGDPARSVIEPLTAFIRAAGDLRTQAQLNNAQTAALVTLAAAGIQIVTGPVTNLVLGGMITGAVAPESIATLRGSALGGSHLQIAVIDNTGVERRASVFAAYPGQIDYLVPRGTSPGKAVAIVSNDSGVLAASAIDIEPVAPGLFTWTDGLSAAGLVLRVKADGTRSVDSTLEPIDLGAPGDQVFLTLFGTGIRGAAGTQSVTARYGNRELPVTFAGPQGSYDGLDQVNLLLPRTLAGAGTVDIALTVNGWEANIVTVTVR